MALIDRIKAALAVAPPPPYDVVDVATSGDVVLGELDVPAVEKFIQTQRESAVAEVALFDAINVALPRIKAGKVLLASQRNAIVAAMNLYGAP